jgi:hypothetical protein
MWAAPSDASNAMSAITQTHSNFLTTGKAMPWLHALCVETLLARWRHFMQQRQINSTAGFQAL